MDQWNDHEVMCEQKAGAVAEAPIQLPPSCDPLIRGWGLFDDEYRSAVTQLLAGPFSETAVEESVTAWQAQINDAVSEAFASDPLQLSPEDWQAGLSDFRDRVATLRATATSAAGGSSP